MEKIIAMFFKTVNGTFYRDNAADFLSRIPAGEVDLVLTDPPYGLGFGEYDDEKSFYAVLSDIYRILRNDGWFVVWWSVKRIAELINKATENGFSYKWILVVYLGRNAAAKSPVGDREWAPVLLFAKGNPQIYQRHSDVIFGNFELPKIRFKPKNRLYKPTFTNYVLLSYFSDINHIVVDPFAGLGSIPITCELSQRYWLASEVDENTFLEAHNIFVKNGIAIEEASLGDDPKYKNITITKSD